MCAYEQPMLGAAGDRVQDLWEGILLLCDMRAQVPAEGRDMPATCNKAADTAAE